MAGGIVIDQFVDFLCAHPRMDFLPHQIQHCIVDFRRLFDVPDVFLRLDQFTPRHLLSLEFENRHGIIKLLVTVLVFLARAAPAGAVLSQFHRIAASHSFIRSHP